MHVSDREGMGGTLTLGEGVKIDDSASIDISADVTVGEAAAISDDVLILTHGHTPGTMAVTASPLVIGPRAWIAARVIVLASCDSIGEGAVVGAGSVVTHDVPAGEVWAGNPARFIRRV